MWALQFCGTKHKLGFTSYPFPENPPFVFASVCRDEIEIMFQRIEGYQKPDDYSLRRWRLGRLYSNGGRE